MPIQLPDARALSDEAIQVLRLRALRGIEMGFTEDDLADLLGVRRETVSRWWRACRSDGLPSLPGGRTGRPQGSGRSLSDQQAQRIQTLIDGNTPEGVGIPHALWTRRPVRELIRKEFQIVLAVRTVGLYLHRWGYTPQRPAAPGSRTPARSSGGWRRRTRGSRPVPGGKGPGCCGATRWG
ncbi:MAG: winged helix-turn-helix domain-containing protein [Gemmataceae bacterium]